MKQYTSIEQSTYLLSLGLDKNTADMWYDFANHIRVDKRDKNYNWSWIPCWSLGALLEVMPKWDDYRPFIGKDECYYVNDDNEIYHREIGTPIEAAFNMVVWLLKKGMASSTLKR